LALGVIHPLVLLTSYVFVFGAVLKVKLRPGQVTDNYPMFLFAGMLPWLLFSETVLRCSSSLVEQANLITKTVFRPKSSRSRSFFRHSSVI